MKILFELDGILLLFLLLFVFVSQGIRDEASHFIVEKRRAGGYVSLQSASQRGLYLGMKPDGRVWPTVDTGVQNVHLFPQVVECKLSYTYITIKKIFLIHHFLWQQRMKRQLVSECFFYSIMSSFRFL